MWAVTGSSTLHSLNLPSSSLVGTNPVLYSSTASPTMRIYKSNPTSAMWPDCSPPNKLPAPRISKSLSATCMPEPRSVFVAIVVSRSCATSVSGLSALYRK